MAYIKTLKDNELIGGTDNTDVYPVSTTQAIFSQKPDGTIPEGIKHQRLEERLFDGEEDCRELHRKAEKLVPHISGVLKEKNTQEEEGTTISSPVEINGKFHTWTITGSAGVETYGDEPTQDIDVDSMTEKVLTAGLNSSSITPDVVEGHPSNPRQIEEETKYFGWTGTYNVPNTVGTYKANFKVTYNKTTKTESITMSTNLRKYFGFVPSTIIQQGNNAVLQYLISNSGSGGVTTSNFSGSVSCSPVLPANNANNEKFKYVYLAVPNNMTISKVTQTSTGYEFYISQIGTASRTIDINGISTSYTYKIYRSDETDDSSVTKGLVIS